MANVDFTIKNNLCISCGICKAVCPVGAINYEKINGQYLPQIDLTKCINCGLCLKICPGNKLSGEKYLDKSFEWHNIIGKYESCFVVQAKDEIVLRNSASGGFVSTIVYNLLKDKDYDAAYLLPNKNYSNDMPSLQKITTVGDVFNCAKSKYIPVSAYNLILDLKKSNKEKYIILGTPCVLQGIKQYMTQFNIDYKKHFFIGLFCDRTLTQNIYNYFEKNTIIQ